MAFYTLSISPLGWRTGEIVEAERNTTQHLKTAFSFQFIDGTKHILMLPRVVYTDFLKYLKRRLQNSQGREALKELFGLLALLPYLAVFQIEYARKNVNSANKKLLGAQEKLYQSWVEWKKNTGQNDGDDLRSAEVNRCKCTPEINVLYPIKLTVPEVLATERLDAAAKGS